MIKPQDKTFTQEKFILKVQLSKIFMTKIFNPKCLGFLQVRISQDTEHFLINPFGMLYNEITASGLVKVDMQGEVVEPGTTNFGVNIAGFMLHAAIHSARPDLKCVVHVHMPNIVAVSLATHNGVKLILMLHLMSRLIRDVVFG